MEKRRWPIHCADAKRWIDNERRAGSSRRMPSFHEFWVFYVASLLFAVRALFGPYLGKKGENIATREDIAELTQKVAEVNSLFSAKFEALAQSNREDLQARSYRHDLSMAAIDTRLEIHQEAFRRGFELYFKTHDDDGRAVAIANLQWWREHCLYLSPNSSNAFMRACIAASMHAMLMRHNIDVDKLEDNWAKIDGVWEVIAADVKLPQLGAQARTAAEREKALNGEPKE